MPSRRIIALFILLPFTLLSVYAVQQVGYWGIFDYHWHSPAGWQVFTDLVIAVFLAMLWMVKDARQTGRNVVPYLIVSLLLGSFGPLLYLSLTPARSETTAH